MVYAFNKHSWNNSYTSVDHINRVRNDNTLGNLQWSDAKNQASNRDEEARVAKTSKQNGHPVEARNPSTGKNEWQHFDSGSMAKEATGANATAISRNMKNLKPGEIYTHKNRRAQPTGWQFRRPQHSI